MKSNGYKEVCIFLAGSTPQVITETLYALAVKDPPIFTDEIYIITTAKGKQASEDTLIGKGVLDNLAEEYGMPRINLTDSSYLIPADGFGNPLQDIRDEQDNERMGDLITEFLRERSSDPAVRIHCSLAGGRKTMSFYLGAAMQLFGRPWDRLYHVLVTPEFESNPEFFYKPKEDKVIECRLPDGSARTLHTRDAEICLAELPFIRLSRKLSLHSGNFRQLVAEGQGEIETATIQPWLKVNHSDRTISVGDSLIEVVPVQLMIFTAFLRQKTEHCKYPERPYCLDCTDCFLSLNDLSSRAALEAMAGDYSRIYGNDPFRREDLLEKWKEGMEPQALRQNISKVNKEIKEHLGNEVLLPYYTVASVRKYGDSRYGVRVEKGKIKIE